MRNTTAALAAFLAGVAPVALANKVKIGLAF